MTGPARRDDLAVLDTPMCDRECMMNSEWIELDAADHAHIDAVEAHGVLIDGQLGFLLVRTEPDDEFDTPWATYAVLRADQEGFSGLEHLDGYESLADGRKALDEDVRAWIRAT